MIAARKTDVADLNERARALMIAAGEVSGEALPVAGRGVRRRRSGDDPAQLAADFLAMVTAGR